MNSPIPSLLLPLKQNKSLCKTIGMKVYVTCTFIHMKIKSFSCETFSTSTRSKEANGNSEVEVKSACICMCQAAHQASTYSSFCSMWLEVFLLPLGWDASSSQRYPQHAFNLPVPLYTPEWILRYCLWGLSVSPRNPALHTAGAREIWIDQSGFSRREKF